MAIFYGKNMRVFEYAPQWGMEMKKKPRVNTLSFGDGYEQRIPQGINNNLRVYSVSFSGSEELINEIDKFLNDHGAVKSFLWTPYNSTQQGYFKCEEWGVSHKTGFFTLSAEFKEVIGSNSQQANEESSSGQCIIPDDPPDLVAILNRKLEQLNG
ncbi:TPA: phage tail protein [Pasteurella multocida]